jgi:hypothetical protein
MEVEFLWILFKYDRMRVLTTELRRLPCEGRGIEILLGIFLPHCIHMRIL